MSGIEALVYASLAAVLRFFAVPGLVAGDALLAAAAWCDGQAKQDQQKEG